MSNQEETIEAKDAAIDTARLLCDAAELKQYTCYWCDLSVPLKDMRKTAVISAKSLSGVKAKLRKMKIRYVVTIAGPRSDKPKYYKPKWHRS